MLKLKVGTGTKKADATSPAAESPPPLERKSSGFPKISFKPKTPATENAPSLPPPSAKPSKKNTKLSVKTDNVSSGSKVKGPMIKLGKRPRKDDDDELAGPSPAKRQVKPTQRALSSKLLSANPERNVTVLKLNTKLASAPSSSVKLKFTDPNVKTPKSLRVKSKGKPPKREKGWGYDSEDDEAEIDPTVESQFILRMQPGDDCDYLRAAIGESAVKHKPDGSKAVGPDVWMKFFDKDGRRGVVSVRGNLYAAALLDLPCVVETMKSWDKKGWYKTADVCQILIVLGRVEDEELAKTFPLPPEADEQNSQYPHGLTPPMQWVRKRRFRHRVNRRKIERVEADVEELIRRDQEWERLGEMSVNVKDKTQTQTQPTHSISLEFVDPDAIDGEDEDMDEADDYYEREFEDQDGNVIMQEEGEEDAEGSDDGDLAALLEAEFDEPDAQEGATPSAFITDPSMLQASPDTLAHGESAVTPLSGVTTSVTGDESEDEDEDEEDEDDEVAEDEEDEERKAQRQEREQALAEVAETRREIAEAEERYKKQTNPLLKMKVRSNLEKLKLDLQVKISGLGLDDEE